MSRKYTLHYVCVSEAKCSVAKARTDQSISSVAVGDCDLRSLAGQVLAEKSRREEEKKKVSKSLQSMKEEER